MIFLYNCYCAHTHQLRMIVSRVAVGLHADLVACRSKNAEGLYAERLAQRCKGSGFCLTGQEKIFQKRKKSREKKVQCTRAEAIEGPMPKSTRAHVENAPKEHVYTNSFREGNPRQLLPPAPPVVLITCFTKEWANPFLSTLDCTIPAFWDF